MSSSVTATWARVGASGSWADPTQWNPASVPGSGSNVQIGNATTAPTVPWTVTVAGAQAAANLSVEMGTNGTLSVSGALNVGGNATLGYGLVNSIDNGVTVDLGAGASLVIAGNLGAELATFAVEGGTISTGGYADLSSSAATVAGNGVWNADTLYLARFGFSSLTVGPGGVVNAATALDIGHDGAPQTPFDGVGVGTLDVTGGGLVRAPVLNPVNGSVVEVDAASAIVLGSGASVAGAVAIGVNDTLSLEAARIAANVVDDGTLTALVNPTAATSSAGTGPDITGALSGSGSVLVGTGYTLEVHGAAGFAGSLTIEPGGTLKLDAGTPPTGPVHMGGGAIDFAGLAYGGGQPLGYDGASGTLTIGGMSIDVGSGLSLADFRDTLDAGGTGTLLTDIACYAAGTRIATPTGEAMVETLRVGDRVRTAAGRVAPVRWIGRATVDVAAQPHMAPVCIASGAFGPGVPRRDLRVSGDHAIAVGEALIPARRLTNDCTIRQDFAPTTITYVHVELDRHELLLAEGLPAESFLDTGNRGQFEDAAPRLQATGEAEAAALRAFAAHGCLRLEQRGPRVDAARAALRARAEVLGWRLATDPALAIEGDRPGLTVAAESSQTLHVLLPPGTRTVRLASRSFIPALLDPAIPDGRRLGAALALELDGTLPEERAFGPGWYRPDPGVLWRWTNGDATLILRGRATRSLLTVRVLAAGARYWVRDAAAEVGAEAEAA